MEKLELTSLQRAEPICVTGPGRTGTSVTMRALNLLGLYIGPEQALVGPGPGGPRGFWERRDMMKLDDRLLRSRGGSWRNPPPLPPGWERGEELEAELERARTLLERDFAGHDSWGWKNPRVSLTAAFWLRLLPRLRFVICLRNPLDYAASLSPSEGEGGRAFYYSRRGLRGEAAYRHWAAYVASALVNTAGRPRLLVSFEEYFDDLPGTVARLARFAGLPAPSVDSEVWRRLAGFVDPGLRHHRTTPGEVMAAERLPREVATLHLLVEELRVATATGVAPPDGNLARAVEEYAGRLLATGAAAPAGSSARPRATMEHDPPTG